MRILIYGGAFFILITFLSTNLFAAVLTVKTITPTLVVKEPLIAPAVVAPAPAISIKEPVTSIMVREPVTAPLVKEPTNRITIKEPGTAISIKEPTTAITIKEPATAISIKEPLLLKIPSTETSTKNPTLDIFNDNTAVFTGDGSVSPEDVIHRILKLSGSEGENRIGSSESTKEPAISTRIKGPTAPVGIRVRPEHSISDLGVVGERMGAFYEDIRTGGVPADVNALVQAVLRESYMETNEDLAYHAEKVKMFNELKKNIRGYLGELRDAKLNMMDQRLLDPVSTENIGNMTTLELKEQTQLQQEQLKGITAFLNTNFNNKVAEKTDVRNASAEKNSQERQHAWANVASRSAGTVKTEGTLAAREDELNSSDDNAQLVNLDLQSALQKQQQTIQLLSNISKILHDTQMSVVRKIGGGGSSDSSDSGQTGDDGTDNTGEADGNADTDVPSEGEPQEADLTADD